ncbi:MucR family transcriptional regulator [Thermodesulforhabdus norvegica]|uniref:Transcriptional regulator, MucR family n=1 Tax=Thermodesulforhabdus norvegica TaxID=39841 RepID=A0A1I4UCQ2_9BACT|nr:MucR family transcriptional regulator [Thermodesulforhabdus norvegica]SFM86600.1 transcriptional regulator, MucR family [Thermodesulforhabdus norvegica]
MSKKLVEMAVEIVQNMVMNEPMTADDVQKSLKMIFQTLLELKQAEESGVAEELVKEVVLPEGLSSPMDSIQDDYVICLECGAKFKQLTANHLRTQHNMTPSEYRHKWGFSPKQTLSARSLSEIRKEQAKKRGIPENLRKAIEARRKRTQS